MLIELIIEFELRGPGSPGRTCNSKTSYFHDAKQRFPRKINLQVNYCVLLNILQKAMYLASPHLDRVNNKIYPKNARLNENCVQKKGWTSILF